MKIFAFDATEHAATFAAQGWVHIRHGATDEFCEYVRAFVSERRAKLSGKGITGAKDQFLLEFPAEIKYTGELFDAVATLCVLDLGGMTLSERHVKWYESDAPPRPRPHKDRFASQISVGVSIEVPEGAHLVLYPDDDTEANPLVRAGLIDTLLPEEIPERTLHNAREVELFDAPGDVQAFYGSRYWHLRRNAAGTMVVYFKFNDFGCDPLGEDPDSERLRAQTLSVLRDPLQLLGSRPRLSRRFESVTHEYARSGTADWLNVNVWDQPARRISPTEHAVLRKLDGNATIADIASARSDTDTEVVLATVCRLAELGAIDL